MALKTTAWESSDYLKTEAARAAYLQAALQENDPAFFQRALGTLARAQGMQTVADRSQATRAGLYKALRSDGNPEFATVMRVVHAMGYRLAIVRGKQRPAKAKSKAVAPKRTAKLSYKRAAPKR